MTKVALITGASSKLGKKIIEHLSDNGYVIYAGARDPNNLQIQNDSVYPIKLDITKDEECKKVVNAIIKKWGKIDTLINCAGYSLAGPTIDFTSQDHISILNTNVVGPFRLIREVVPFMKKKKYGKIINITSLSGLVAFPNFGLYSSSKFAFEALGRSLRYELEKNNIFVTNIAPGAIKSEVDDAKPLPHKPFREKFKILDLLMPMVTTDKIAKAVLKVSEAKRPGSLIVLGSDAKVTYTLHKLLPSVLWDRLQLFVWNRK